LDLVIRVPRRLAREDAGRLYEALIGTDVRTDAQLETPSGAVSLDEYAHAVEGIVLRCADGARLVADPW
jgi:phosphoribosyl-dephospho-CoA transferase